LQDSIKMDLQRKLELSLKVVASHEETETLLNQKFAVSQSLVSDLKAQLKSVKKKLVSTEVIGGVIVGVLGYLCLKK